MTIKPNFFIVGAAKSGTSSLFYYLELHPDVYMSPIKEPHYFAHEYFPHKFTGPGDEGFSDNRIRDLDDYLKLFSSGKNAWVEARARSTICTFLALQNVYMSLIQIRR